MVCLALELVGPWVVLGFSVGIEAFDELLSLNVNVKSEKAQMTSLVFKIQLCMKPRLGFWVTPTYMRQKKINGSLI